MAHTVGALRRESQAQEPSVAQLQRIIEAQPGCLTRIGSDGTFLAVNETALTMLGAERVEQLLETSFVDLVAPEARENCRAFLTRVSLGERGSIEVGVSGLGGLTRIVQVHAIAHPTPSDSIASALCTFRDVTEYRKLERSLVDAIAQNQQQADAARQAEAAGAEDARADLERRLADAERQYHEAAERYAMEGAQLRTALQSAQQQFEADRAAQAARVAALEEAVRAAEIRERESTDAAQTAREAFEAELRAARGEREQRDAQYTAERAAERLAAARHLEYTERAARAGRLSLALAADLRASLDVAADHGRALLGGDGVGDTRAALEALMAEVMRASSFARQISRVGRQEIRLAVGSVVRALEPMLKALFDPNVSFAVLVGSERAEVDVARNQLEHMVVTLAANRRAAMVRGGQASLEVAEVDIDEGCAREHLTAPGAYVLLALHASGPDAGAGMTAGLFGAPAAAHLWESAGPGLSGVFDLADQVGGHLWARQEGDDGIALEVYLPRLVAVAATAEEPETR
jgi:PAS domain S-box-containing protein